MNRAAMIALADAADALARLARAAAEDEASDPEALLPLDAAARMGATSRRVLRDAIRAGELPAVGRQRDRAVRRRDLETWVASRSVRPVAGVDDLDIERRIVRLTASKRAAR